MSDPCFRNATIAKLTSFSSERVNHSVGNSFWLLLLWVVTARQLWFFGSRRLCFARRLLSRSFVPLQRSHQLTHSLQNALQFLCEGDSVFCLSPLKRIAPGHPPYLFSKMWLLISCQCTLAYSLTVASLWRLVQWFNAAKRDRDQPSLMVNIML